MRLLALKIDIDTYRGTREGVPQLVEALKRHNANATFLWSLGSDHTGRAIKRVFRPGFMKKVSRTSVLEHYGWKTLMYGTLLPGPDIGKRCASIMRDVAAQGFENGIHTWDHVRWQDGVVNADAAWTGAELTAAVERYQAIFDEQPLTHGAAGWQMNPHAYRLEQRLGFRYASDGRGTHPYWPVVNGELVRVPQLPTTLPTLDELIGVDGINVLNVDTHVLKLTETALPTGHVYTLHAELEGMKLLPVFERLLAGWTEQGYKLVSVGELFDTLDLQALPYHRVEMGEITGRSGELALQGAVFP
ncbi:putative 4-deoxy-4-formamido-L-arabinose-phosphoundecaprenol deformylase ArnD [Andreprevotia sp. IGB-42]|uniref:polysaccharide deacetylase family protein n=1 Tax=Andreprevotia sp. IGB-42 TaxID=2497473 RepID=UPI00135BC6E6|nr:polysaccharide deacetylase family protein [Andreprevotia sp. IGB-42]KAF0814270.1 putative 4-deoxy-4-formamido-L-arabinose-phosphoundecaprenol deformylase ArnD [Andreprevotia sp. IGB-42]